MNLKNLQHMPNGGIKLKVSTELYSCDAIEETSYRFTDKVYMNLVAADKGIIEIHILPKQDGINLDILARDFLNELIDQQLRNRIRCETKEIQGIIIKEAFAPLENIPKSNNKEPGERHG